MLNKEFITGIFEGATEDQIANVLKEYDSDVTGLKVNRDQILSESKGHKEKLEKLTADYGVKEADFQKQIDAMKKQLEASGSEELKAYYEAEIKNAQGMYAAQLEDNTKKLAALEAEKGGLYNEYVNVLKNVEFEKAAEKISNLDPAKKAILRDLFFSRNQFDFVTTDGEKKFLSKDGSYKNVNDILLSFVGTDEGKFFLLNNNTGGGATGSGSVKTFTNNPWKKETLNITEQMLITKEKPELAAQLKAQAGV